MLRLLLLFSFFAACDTQTPVSETGRFVREENNINTLEPHGPWEPYSAILTADWIVQGHFDFPPVWEENGSRWAVSIQVEKEWARQQEGLPAGKKAVTLILPTPVDMGEEEEASSRKWPEFFKANEHFIAALNIEPGKGLFEASSAWSYLSFLASIPEHEKFVAGLLEKAVFSRAAALQLGRARLETTEAQLRIDVVGGKITDGKFSQTSAPQSEGVELVWRIVHVSDRTKYLFVRLADGMVLTLE